MGRDEHEPGEQPDRHPELRGDQRRQRTEPPAQSLDQAPLVRDPVSDHGRPDSERTENLEALDEGVAAVDGPGDRRDDDGGQRGQGDLHRGPLHGTNR